jgi:hypothetical protein
MRDEKCHCGGVAKVYGSDWTNEEGPWFVSCDECGFESLTWAYIREARANFRAACRAKLAEAKVTSTNTASTKFEN